MKYLSSQGRGRPPPPHRQSHGAVPPNELRTRLRSRAGLGMKRSEKEKRGNEEKRVGRKERKRKGIYKKRRMLVKKNAFRHLPTQFDKTLVVGNVMSKGELVSRSWSEDVQGTRSRRFPLVNARGQELLDPLTPVRSFSVKIILKSEDFNFIVSSEELNIIHIRRV